MTIDDHRRYQTTIDDHKRYQTISDDIDCFDVLYCFNNSHCILEFTSATVSRSIGKFVNSLRHVGH